VRRIRWIEVRVGEENVGCEILSAIQTTGDGGLDKDYKDGEKEESSESLGAGGVAQVVERLPSKWKVLSSNPST
jgi:hypothetical protein